MEKIEPTSQLRYVDRIIASQEGRTTVRVLQQLWSNTFYEDGRPIRGGTQWKDVPVITAD